MLIEFIDEWVEKYGGLPRITLPCTPVNKAVASVDNRPREAYTVGLRYDAKRRRAPMATGWGPTTTY
jgi:hypothetical protein